MYMRKIIGLPFLGFNAFCMSPDGQEIVGNTVDDCRPCDPLSSIVGCVNFPTTRVDTSPVTENCYGSGLFLEIRRDAIRQ